MDRIALLFVLVRLPGAESHATPGFSLMQRDTAAGRKALVRDDADHKETVAWKRELVQDGADHKDGDDGFVLTWEVPAVLGARPSFNVSRWINVTSSEARQMTGPLTLLLAFRICESAKALQPVLKRVRQKGQAHIHLLGVRDHIEPKMAWKRFLVGPLTNRDQVLVDAFGLPRTPLAGVAVSLLFNGDELSRTNATGDGGLFNEAHTSGLYHKTVTQIPDLVVALNPGFPHYLGNWWHTLRHLWHSQVPIVTTGYTQPFSGEGFALPALYNLKYDAEDATLLQEGADDHHKTVSLLSQPQSGADPATLPDLQTFPVKKQQSPNNTVCAESRSFVGLPQHKATLCSDTEGDALVAGQAGFEVLVTIKNPFVYCRSFSPYRAAPDCQGSEVFHVFHPKKADRHASEAMMIDRKLNASADRMEKSDMEEIPDGLAMQIMRQSLTCDEDWTEHRTCMERRLHHLKKKALPRKARLWVYDFMDDLEWSCAERAGDKYDQVSLDQVTSFH